MAFCLKGKAIVMAPPILAAPSSSRSLVVGQSVSWAVRPLVGHRCEKVAFRVSDGNLNLPTYLPM